MISANEMHKETLEGLSVSESTRGGLTSIKTLRLLSTSFTTLDKLHFIEKVAKLIETEDCAVSKANLQKQSRTKQNKSKTNKDDSIATVRKMIIMTPLSLVKCPTNKIL